jgi:hypothetical protein
MTILASLNTYVGTVTTTVALYNGTTAVPGASISISNESTSSAFNTFQWNGSATFASGALLNVKVTTNANTSGSLNLTAIIVY